MYDLSHSRPAWSADASPATPIIRALRKTGRLAAKSVTNSRCRYAGDIIAKFIVTGMRRVGGNNLGSIPPALRAHCGSKPIHSVRTNWPLLPQIVRGRRDQLQTESGKARLETDRQKRRHSI
jgi:hypothetical protein